MGLDLVAFDYSYDASGQLVVWEANEYPDLSFPAGADVEYTRPFVERSYAAIAAMYLRAAGSRIPSSLMSKISQQVPQNGRLSNRSRRKNLVAAIAG